MPEQLHRARCIHRRSDTPEPALPSIKHGADAEPVFHLLYCLRLFCLLSVNLLNAMYFYIFRDSMVMVLRMISTRMCSCSYAEWNADIIAMIAMIAMIAI